MRRQVADFNYPCLLFIGSLSTANDAGWLREKNIKVVLNVCNDIESERFDGIVYCKWGLDDPKDTLAPRNNVNLASVILHSVLDHAGNLDGNVLIHCAAGHNRSALVAAVYLNKWRGWDWQRAVETCQVKDLKNWMIDKGYNW